MGVYAVARLWLQGSPVRYSRTLSDIRKWLHDNACLHRTTPALYFLLGR